MIVELLDLNGNVCLRKRVPNRMPATVVMPKTVDGSVAISGARFIATATATLVVEGKPVRQHHENFKTPIPLTGGNSIEFGSTHRLSADEKKEGKWQHP